MSDSAFFIAVSAILVAAICAECIPVMGIATAIAITAFKVDKHLQNKKRPARAGTRTRQRKNNYNT